MKKKNSTNAKISTILGKGCVLNGDFSAEGSARIDGTVNGNVMVKGLLVLGVEGRINGNIQAAAALIGGVVNGDIDAPEKLEASAGAKILGDIKTQILVIDEHAIFQGKCDMYQEVQTSKKGNSKPSAKASRVGRKSAKAAIAEALKEVEEENRSQEASEMKETDLAAPVLKEEKEKESGLPAEGAKEA